MSDIKTRLEAARWGIHITDSNRRLSNRAASIERQGGEPTDFVERSEIAISEALRAVVDARALLDDAQFQTRSN